MSLGSEPDADKLKIKGISFFYGFLIAFAILLMSFVMCGTFTRRRLGSAYLLGLGRSSGISRPVEMEESDNVEVPELWEPRIAKIRNTDGKWEDIMPLSAQVVYIDKIKIKQPPAAETQPAPPPPPVIPAPAPRPLATRNPQGLNGLSLPTWSQSQVPLPPPAPLPVPEQSRQSTQTRRPNFFKRGKSRKNEIMLQQVMQVTVIITMPSPDIEHQSEKEGVESSGLSGYQLGVMGVPWTDSTDI